MDTRLTRRTLAARHPEPPFTDFADMQIRLVLPTIIALAIIPAFAEAQHPTDRLDWLAGCWELRTPNILIEEQWMAPRGGMLLGMSRTVRGSRAVAYENLRIYVDSGRFVYEATPSGQTRTEFRTADTTNTADLRFENPAHDFPQRILYRPVGRDSLAARIEGTRGGQTRGSDFSYRRVSCPGGAH